MEPTPPPTPNCGIGSMLHCWCKRGKQSTQRGGFPWTVPPHLLSIPTFNWAEKLVEEWEKLGKIKSGDILIEPTSGNTGIGLCLTAALKGYKMIICLPQKMSGEASKTPGNLVGGRVPLLCSIPLGTWSQEENL